MLPKRMFIRETMLVLVQDGLLQRKISFRMLSGIIISTIVIMKLMKKKA